MKLQARYTPETIRRHTRQGPWSGQTVADLFRRHFPDRAERVAVVDDRQAVTYGQIDEWADRIAALFLDLGLTRGDRVAVQLPNSAEFCAVYFGAQKVGVVPVGFPASFRDTEVGYILERTESRAYVAPGEWGGFDYQEMLGRLSGRLAADFAGAIVWGGEGAGSAASLDAVLEGGRRVTEEELAANAPDPNDVAQLLVTSGTEAEPKMPMWVHNAMPGMGAIADAAGMGADERNFVLVPACSGFGMGVGPFMTLAGRGATMVVREKFVPAETLQTIADEDVNVMCGVGAQFIALLNDPNFDSYDFSSLHTVISFGGPVPSRVIAEVEERMGCHFVSGYGMSEVSCPITMTRRGDPPEVVSTAVGRPFPEWITIRIVDPDSGAELPTGEVGEIVLDGPGVGGGYFGNDTLNAAWDAEGWFHSGDLGFVAADGNLTIVGRTKDIIIRGGQNISPREVEEAVFAHPAVREVTVVAMPDERMGEKACAFAILKEGASLDLSELRRFLTEERNLAVFKVPERLEIVDEFPMTPSGKVQRFVLRQSIEKQLADESGEAT